MSRSSVIPERTATESEASLVAVGIRDLIQVTGMTFTLFEAPLAFRIPLT